MKLPVYPIGSFYFIRGKLSSIRSGTTPTIRTIFQRAAIRKPAPSECPPLKPDPDMEKRLNDPLIQYYIKLPVG